MFCIPPYIMSKCKARFRTIQIHHQPDATIFQFIILTFIYSSTCFGRSPAHHQELMTAVAASGFYLRFVVIVVLCSWSGRQARPRTQHTCHHDTKVKPEAATAVIEVLMMGGKTPETCWAVNKRQDNKLKNCCIWLVIYLNCTMMHGLTNLKFKKNPLFILHFSGSFLLTASFRWRRTPMYISLFTVLHSEINA